MKRKTGTHRFALSTGRPAAVLILAGMTGWLACAGCWPTLECGPSGGLIARVIDGDTVELSDGTRVRMLGIDAPETGTCWGAQARAAATSMLEGRLVGFEYLSTCTDDYGRTLAHIIINGEDASRVLAGAGAVCAWILQDDPGAAGIRGAARAAAAAGSGFWGACPEVPCRSN